MSEYRGVIQLCEHREDEELAGTGCMPLLVAFSSVNIGCAAHKQERAHYAHDKHDCGPVLMHIDNFFHPHGLDIKVINKPPQQHQRGPRNRGNSKEHIFRVMIGHI